MTIEQLEKAQLTEIQTVVNGEIKSIWIPALTEKPDDLICADLICAGLICAEKAR
jgi:hypothetical protein